MFFRYENQTGVEHIHFLFIVLTFLCLRVTAYIQERCICVNKDTLYSWVLLSTMYDTFLVRTIYNVSIVQRTLLAKFYV